MTANSLCCALMLLAPPLYCADIALLIGISSYNEGLEPLPGVKHDIEGMRRMATVAGFSHIRELREDQATRQAIATAIARIAQEAAPEDRVLIYFSGHGSTAADYNGDESDGRDELLVTADTIVVGSRLRNYLLDDRFEDMLSGIQSRHVLVILDTCHSGTATKGLASDDLVSKAAGYEGEPDPEQHIQSKGLLAPATRYALLAACHENEVAKAAPEGSLLTQALTSLISRWRKQGRPILLRPLRDAIETEVHTRYAKQHPQLSGDTELSGENWFFAGR